MVNPACNTGVPQEYLVSPIIKSDTDGEVEISHFGRATRRCVQRPLDWQVCRLSGIGRVASSSTFEEELLAHYQVRYAPDGRHIQALSQARLYLNGHPSPQLYLPGLEGDWPLTIQLPSAAPHRRVAALGVQERLVVP